MGTKKLEIVQIMRAFACISIYHLTLVASVISYHVIEKGVSARLKKLLCR